MRSILLLALPLALAIDRPDITDASVFWDAAQGRFSVDTSQSNTSAVAYVGRVPFGTQI